MPQQGGKWDSLTAARTAVFWEEWTTGGRQPWGRAPCYFVRGAQWRKGHTRGGEIAAGNVDRRRGCPAEGQRGKDCFVLCAEVCYNRNEKPYGRAA